MFRAAIITEKFKNTKSAVKKAITPTIMATLIFFMTYYLFGTENTMIGPFATLSFLRFRTMRSHYECMVKNFGIYFAMAFLAFFSVMNLPLCIIVNALALFWIADILIDEYNPTNYFPAGMALIFFQIAPVYTPAALLNRLEALLATFVLVFLFVFILSKIEGKKNTLPDYIRERFENSRQQLELCRFFREDISQTRKMQKDNVSGSDRMSFMREGMSQIRKPQKDNVSASDRMNDTQEDMSQNPETAENRGKPTSGSTADASRIRKGTAPAFDTLERLHRELADINKKISSEIYARNRASLFPRGKTNWYCQFVLLFQLINYLTLNYKTNDNLIKAEKLYRDFRTRFKTVEPTPDYRRLNFRLKKPDIRSFRLRFALRQVITVTPCLVFARASGLPNVYWLVISVFFMMIPFTDHTMQRIRQRVGGTVAGIVICLILFSVFGGFASHVAIMTVANFLIYSASGYGPTVAYITCSALALQTLGASVALVLGQRLLYTLIGAVIALIANKWIFPIRFKYQIEYLAEMIRSIRGELIRIDQNAPHNEAFPKWEVDQRIVKSYLLTKRLENMCESLPPKEQHFNYRDFEKKHMNIMAEFLTGHLL
ncbi:MAG: FUSC family protein [Lachnospiraceae bacterium]|nr:FUSC family protein [Lachnospiraceae bacterium]